MGGNATIGGNGIEGESKQFISFFLFGCLCHEMLYAITCGMIY